VGKEQNFQRKELMKGQKIMKILEKLKEKQDD